MACLILSFMICFGLETPGENNQWEEQLKERHDKKVAYGLKRSSLFIKGIKEIFRNESIPEELAWIPLIESSFRPYAVSRNGAVGLFQFKKETAVHFGLRVEKNRDERTFPFLSAQACARYLKYLYRKFEDWDLVLAAYNMGEGALHRLLLSTGTKKWIQVKVYLRKETREYVPKVHAAARIGEVFLKKKSNPHCFLVRVEKGDTLRALSSKHRCDLEELQRVNGITGKMLQNGQTLIIPVGAF